MYCDLPIQSSEHFQCLSILSLCSGVTQNPINFGFLSCMESSHVFVHYSISRRLLGANTSKIIFKSAMHLHNDMWVIYLNPSPQIGCMDTDKLVKPTRRQGLKKIPAKNITLRLPEELYEIIDSQWKQMGFSNRTDLIEQACKWYFETNECPRCKARNPPNGVKCAVCGQELKPYYVAIDELVKKYREMMEKKENLSNILRNLMSLQDSILELINTYDETSPLRGMAEQIMKYLIHDRNEIASSIELDGMDPYEHGALRLVEVYDDAEKILENKYSDLDGNTFVSLSVIDDALDGVYSAMEFMGEWVERANAISLVSSNLKNQLEKPGENVSPARSDSK